ncbi:histidine phosphatase family protein [Raoultibacter massiliensis]|uniref:Histidine phosphatase family protein n=1 Tax=Raoultibacter massiliensis TaxID=1852371 RepID=A0ABV1J9A4_9ACTN|nr:histidine phosphatase family protein [Raoultibacter massiliensis]
MARDTVFYVVRHGQTLFNVLQKVQGWCDSPLTEQGVAVARKLGAGLAATPFSAAYSSDSGRAVATLAEVLEPNASEVQPRSDWRLREWCYGDLEGEPGSKLHDVLAQGFGADLPMTELNGRLPEIADVLADRDGSGRSERFDAIEDRVTSFFTEAGARACASGGGNVLVVTHAFTIKTLLYLYARDRVNERPKIENASVTKLRFDGISFEVGTIGDTAYAR